MLQGQTSRQRMTNTFDAFLRRTNLSARKDTSTLASAAFRYDSVQGSDPTNDVFGHFMARIALRSRLPVSGPSPSRLAIHPHCLNI